MATTSHARMAGLMLLAGVLGLGAVLSAPAETHIGGMWPVGLVAGLLVYVGRRTVPAIAGGFLLLVFATFAARRLPARRLRRVRRGHRRRGTGHPQGAHGPMGLRPSPQRRPRPCPVHPGSRARRCDRRRAVRAHLGRRRLRRPRGPWVSVSSPPIWPPSSSCSPFFMEEFRHPGESGRQERWLRWTVTVLVTLAAFVPTQTPGVVFFVLPRDRVGRPARTDARGAVAAGGRGHHRQRADPVRPRPVRELDVLRNRPPELEIAPQQAFLLGCALVCLPFAMAVARSRQQRQAEVVSERERLRRIVSGATGMAIIETDEHGQITLFNPGAERCSATPRRSSSASGPTCSTPPRRSRGRPSCSAYPRRSRTSPWPARAPQVGPRDWRYVRKDGQVRTMSMTLAQMTDNNGAVVGYLSTAEDITERVRAQSALEAALQTERRAVAHLTEIDRTKDAFVSSVSHELRTPITNIVGYLELLLDGAYGETNDSQHEALGRIDSNSHRLLELIDNLLTLSSLESLDVQLSKQPVDLREVIRRSGQKVHLDATERGQHLDVDVPAEPGRRTRRRGAPRADGLQPGHQRGEVHPRRRPHHLARAQPRARTPRSRSRTPAWASPRRTARCCSTASTAPPTPRPRPSAAAGSASRSPAASPICTAPGSARESTPGEGSTFTVDLRRAGVRRARGALIRVRARTQRPN